jgi:hypothetical protein
MTENFFALLNINPSGIFFKIILIQESRVKTPARKKGRK